MRPTALLGLGLAALTAAFALDSAPASAQGYRLYPWCAYTIRGAAPRTATSRPSSSVVRRSAASAACVPKTLGMRLTGRITPLAGRRPRGGLGALGRTERRRRSRRVPLSILGAVFAACRAAPRTVTSPIGGSASRRSAATAAIATRIHSMRAIGRIRWDPSGGTADTDSATFASLRCYENRLRSSTTCRT